MRSFSFIIITTFFCLQLKAQNSWKVSNTPSLTRRVDDLFMLNPTIGYAVCGDGKIMKTSNGGDDWNVVTVDSNVYCRSVEFVNEKKGFVGSLPNNFLSANNILRKTLDGGITWIDITSTLNIAARKGICGLDVADSNTIYGCGNYYDDSGYIIKSLDGGTTWSFIDMHKYASSLIDMYFFNKDTGFVTGMSSDSMRTAIILYTSDGGLNWTYKFKNDKKNEYCWKIQFLSNNIFFASIQDENDNTKPTILKSFDNGNNWTKNIVHSYQPYSNGYILQGVGFINNKVGWAGGDFKSDFSFKTDDGGITWNTAEICPGMDRVFRVDDTLLFATGINAIWKYSPSHKTHSDSINTVYFTSLKVHPNPANSTINIALSLIKPTHALINLFDINGNKLKTIDNSNKNAGLYNYSLNTSQYPANTYILYLQTNDDIQSLKFIIKH